MLPDRHVLQKTSGRWVELMTGLVLLLRMASLSPAASSRPELTIPNSFGVNIHFTDSPQYLLLAE